MVELTAPNAKDVICDPASGTCGFLVAAGEYLHEIHPELLRDAQEVVQQATEQSHGLGIFIRSLVGLDRETASQAFSQFVISKTAKASQMEFIVQYLTENGVMDAARLYESPFTDISQQGPGALFLPGRVTEMIQVLDDIRERAVA